jgi:hypothetical protein
MSRPETHESAERPLISNATILILSGFLVGLTVGKIVAEDLSPYVLSCGLSGFLAFIALELAAERRLEEAARADRGYVAQRLDRHITARGPSAFSVTADRDGQDSPEGSPEVQHARQFYGAAAVGLR